MTESLHAAQRRVGALPAPDEVDAEPAPVRPVPVVGLVFGTPQHDQLGGPIARPGSVVEALRRQAIRRSGTDTAMDLGEESTEDDSEEEPEAWTGTVDEAGADIVGWLRDEAGNATNYTVAVCGTDIYITKVNGVTAGTALMGELEDHIKENGIDQVYNIYLCQKYNTSQPSNHAEMCAIAAIGLANIGNITFFECTAASCDYCDAFLAHYNVPNTSPENDPASQAGWTHPFQALAWGTQLGGHAAQVAELTAYLDHGTAPRIGRVITTAPAGRCTHWL
jgi:hypothetical protein